MTIPPLLRRCTINDWRVEANDASDVRFSKIGSAATKRDFSPPQHKKADLACTIRGTLPDARSFRTGLGVQADGDSHV
jgi:hypothetical protein